MLKYERERRRSFPSSPPSLSAELLTWGSFLGGLMTHFIYNKRK